MTKQIKNMQFQANSAVGLEAVARLRKGKRELEQSEIPEGIPEQTGLQILAKKPFARNVCFVFIIILTIIILNKPRYAFAQTYSLSLSPSLLEVVIKPGKSITQDFKITNNADPAILTPRIIPMNINRDNGDIVLPEELPTIFDGSTWFSLVDEDVRLNEPIFLNSQQTLVLKLHIDIPTNTAPADYYYHLILESQAPPPEQNTISYIKPHIGSNILISLSQLGTLNKTAEISQFSTPIFIDSFDTIDTILTLKNTGAAFLKPSGTLTIKGLFSESKYDILPQNILAGTTRMVQTTEGLKNKTSDDSTLQIKGFFLGLHSINAKVKIDNTNIVINKQIHFVALPYKAGALILIVYLLIRKLKPGS